MVACRRRQEGKAASILERRGPSLAKKEKEEEKKRIYVRMPDGSLVFDLVMLPEILESYRHYFR